MIPVQPMSHSTFTGPVQPMSYNTFTGQVDQTSITLGTENLKVLHPVIAGQSTLHQISSGSRSLHFHTLQGLFTILT